MKKLLNEWTLLTLALIGVGAVYFLNPRAAKMFADLSPQPPRNTSPIEEYTRFYTRHELPADKALSRPPLTYFLYEPQKPYPATLKFPLVILLHGAPGFAYAGKYLIAGQMRIDYPAFVVAPVIPANKFWAFPSLPLDDPRVKIGDVARLAENLSTSYPVDRSRIYAVGCSEGGWGVFGLARHYPDLLAAAVPMSGGWDEKDAGVMTKTPLWVIHGEKDSIYPVQKTRDLVYAIRSAGGTANYTELAGMEHNCPYPPMYSKPLWQWLFSHKRK